MRTADLASPRKWIGADIECDAGCGVVPFRYREQSYVNALQWAIGLELFLLVSDPWRVVLTTDHPNGGPFTSYPHLIRLLMDKPFRDEQLARLHPDVAAHSSAARDRRASYAARDRDHDARRAGAPARACATAAISAWARPPTSRSIASRPTARPCSRTPEYVFKDGVLVARARARSSPTPVGGVALRRARLRPRHRDDFVADYADRHLTVTAADSVDRPRRAVRLLPRRAADADARACSGGDAT